jgi:hypothetical protein
VQVPAIRRADPVTPIEPKDGIVVEGTLTGALTGERRHASGPASCEESHA